MTFRISLTIMNNTAPAISLRNTVWLTIAFALVAAPHTARLPLWLSALVGAMCLWRVYLARTRMALPARWLLIAIVTASAAAIFLHYRTLFGRDAGVALLVLMLSLKFMETRSQRDGMVLAFIGYFLVITNFFYAQSIPTALYLLACVWFITAAMINLQHTREPAGYRGPLRTSAIMLAQSVPLMVVFFILFPRMQGPLWGMPSDAFAGVTGLSDSMSPGTINKLVFSDEVAMRAEFTGPIPPPNRLYWRGPVLTDFDGHTWTAPPRLQFSRIELERRAMPTRYNVTIEPHNRRWLFALDMPGVLPVGAGVSPEQLLLSQRPVTSRMRYNIESFLDYTYGTDGSSSMPRRALLHNALQLPTGLNPRTLEMGRELRGRYGGSGTNGNAGNNEAIMTAVLTFFREQKFTYTLEPPLLGHHSVDEFIFTTRQGFCEHFSSAFVVLMRAAGVPARVVTGYLGGEYNPLGNYLIVRQSDAHAWAEVWIENRGWVRVDPTNAVSPARADGGLAAAIPEGARLQRGFLSGKNPLLHQVALTLDSIANHWNQTVLGYNLESQRALLYRAGIDGDTLRTLAALLIAATILVTLILALATLTQRRRAREPALAAYQKFCDKMAKAGIARGDAEGPVDFATRIARTRPEFADTAHNITRLYVSLRYQNTQENNNKNKYLQQLQQNVKAFAV
jgi:transglutaminase-like putative cysteine protease